MKILLVAPHKSKIGTTKIFVNTANALCTKHSVFVLDICNEWEGYSFDARVIIVKNQSYFRKMLIYLGQNNILRSRPFMILASIWILLFLPSKFKVHKIEHVLVGLITMPTIIVSKIYNIQYTLSMQGLPQFLENLHSDRLNYFEGSIRQFGLSLLKPQSIIFMTESTKKLYEDNFGTPKQSMVISNPVITEDIQRKAEQIPDFQLDDSKTRFVLVGRLTKQKNFNLLIDALQHIKNKDEYIFYILGEGELRSELSKRIEKLGLQDKIILAGYQENPYAIMRESQIFLQTSLWEDPGHALIEAAYLGLFCISSNCPNGPSEILKDGKAGLLYKNNSALELAQLLDNLDNYRNQNFTNPDIEKYHFKNFQSQINSFFSL